ncbi:MAG: zinc ribbon domain-containing protein [Proteobacteria bacterium]|nr:zinc ribbon domain-containing protein [Pseudomonadota bacterium]MBU1452035.1 zinc ribbon domain-containing protein [Pseudomonadota bacterium]MBU2467742.1 zinc ribbon domain-containing protein [Pseudomonadota bacterium]MBU2517498.1 zinc ribbon domain-containing protein [Pseudomonadota bacterium]
MPFYEYECCKCNQISEALQKVSDPPLKKCPHCGGKLKKIISLNSFHLKGGGWYVTDYKGKNSSTAAPSDSSAGSDSAPKSDTPAKKETKAATPKADKS